MIVTPQNYPKVFAAFSAIDCDNGLVNRYNPAKEEFMVPPEWQDYLGFSEESLAKLDYDDFYTFCTGEQGDANEIASNLSFPCEVRELLEAYFMEWHIEEEDEDE